MDATYVSANSFTVVGDQTSIALPRRRVRADCGVDGYRYSTVESSNYSSPNTTVVVTESELTSNITTIDFGVVSPGDTGSLPPHQHDGEGDGGTTISGLTSLHVDGDATVTGTIYAHVYDSYSPLIMKSNGVTVISGSDITGIVEFPQGITVSGSEIVGTQGPAGVSGTAGVGGIDGVDGEDGREVWHSGSGAPSINLGEYNDLYLEEVTGVVYRKDDPALTADITGAGTATASSQHTYYDPSRAVDNDLTMYQAWAAEDPNNVWWKYDLGSGNEAVVTTVRLISRYYDGGAEFKNFRIEASNNNSDWDVLHADIHADNDQWQAYHFTNETAYRWYRIFIIDKYPSPPWIAILELELLEGVWDWQELITLKGTDGAQGPAGVSGTAGVDGIDGTDGSDAPTTFSGLSDTPNTYDAGKYLMSTASGSEWVEAQPLDYVDSDSYLEQLIAEFSYDSETPSGTVTIDDDSEIIIEVSNMAVGASNLNVTINNDTGNNYEWGNIYDDSADAHAEDYTLGYIRISTANRLSSSRVTIDPKVTGNDRAYTFV